MIQTAVELMRERGVEATSFSEILAASGAPRGSIYYHFPDGKEQLIEEATRWAGDFISKGEEAALAAGPLHALHALVEYWRITLRQSDFLAGCPIAAVAVEGELRPRARGIASEVFERWESLLAASLRRHRVPRKRAPALATTVIAAIEGAVILARARRSLSPLDRVAGELEGVLSEALAAASED